MKIEDQIKKYSQFPWTQAFRHGNITQSNLIAIFDLTFGKFYLKIN